MSLQTSHAFRRWGQRDDRRRRLLTDEIANADVWPVSVPDSPCGASPSKTNRYADFLFSDQLPSLFDLIPRRILGHTALFVTGAVVIAGLGGAYSWAMQRTTSGGNVAAALDLANKGSLGCWFSSLLVLAAAAVAGIIYLVRRHRTDDYQGRYRVWCWAAAFWLFLAADQAASLREAFRDVMTALTGTALFGDGSLWWVAAYVLAIGALGSRLLVDMQPCWPSLGFLIVSAITHFMTVAYQLHWLSTPGDITAGLLAGIGQMSGNLLLLMAMLLFARHVLLDAEGVLPHHDNQTESHADMEDEEEDETDAMWKKVDSPHGTPQPVFQRVATPKASATASAPVPSSHSFHPPVNRKLTKGEKKALKERLLRERADRERRGL